MTGFLIKTFIKDAENVKDTKVRQAYGIFSGIVGIICNVILFAFKFLAGAITGSVSISADAFNNLSDAGSSIITLLGFKMAGKPADPDHPYGHGRIEYLAGLIVSGAIMIMGFELFKDSVVKIFHPEDMEFSVISVVILLGSIIMKLWMSFFNRKLGKKIDSTAMLATATDSLSDCVSTSVVLISLLITTFSGINVDGFAGAVVAVFVFIAGVEAAKDTIQPLLGQPPEKEFVDEVERLVMEDEHIIGIHDLIVHDYGPGRVFVSVHAEVPYTMNMLEAHDIIDIAERRVAEALSCGISIHMDPVVTDDVAINELKAMALQVIRDIDPMIKMHDFRTTQGPFLKNLIFDIVVPFGYELSDEELKKKISTVITEKNDKFYCVITVDKMYTRD